MEEATAPVWKERYRRAQEAFQGKHVETTRLEIRVDALEQEHKKLARALAASAEDAKAEISKVSAGLGKEIEANVIALSELASSIKPAEPASS